MSGAPRILIVGGGYGGMHTALRLERLLRPGEATITVADPRSYMTYQPLLAEAAAGNLEPRHVVVPLRSVLHRTQIIKATVSSVDHARRVAHLSADDGEDIPLGYDVLVLSPGSISRVLPIPGLAEAGIGFKTIGEAIYLRNHVLARLDAAASARSAQARDAALTFVFVGGGYAGVEALAELQDMAHDVVRALPGDQPPGDALGPGGGRGPDPARGQRGDGELHGRAAAPPPDRSAAAHPAGLGRRRPRDP